MGIADDVLADSEIGGVAVSSVEESTAICVTDYKQDFVWLWDLDTAGAKPSNGFGRWLETRAGQDATVVIAWEGMPELSQRELQIPNHVTPFDWALSVSNVLLKSDKDGFPYLRIVIVDDYSSSNLSDSIFVLSMLDSIKAAMPWLKVANSSGGCGRYLRAMRDGDFSCLEEAAAGHRNQVQSLNYAWQAMTASTDEGHSINNVVGPLLLLGDPVLADRPLVGALWHRIQSLTLPQKEGEGDAGALLTESAPWIDWKADDWKKKLERLGGGKTKLKLLVLDDQWQDGWGEVICKAVGVGFDSTAQDQANRFTAIGSNKVSGNVIQVKACGTADWLFETDKPLSNTSDQRFKLQLDDGGEDWQEILFLDLRLYSSKSVEEEARFIGTLVERARQIQKREVGELPWPGFEEDELKRIEAWVEGKKHDRKDSSYHEALTLLPRIISLLDLSYPVIFFSSTGRREIVESFKEHSNIITDFDKPRLTGVLAGDLASLIKINFRHAMEQSLSMLQSRNRCLAFFNAQNPYGSASGPDIKNERAYHVELYIDETDPYQYRDKKPSYRKGWRVGGCYALFDGGTEKEAREKADKFEDSLVKVGVRYFINSRSTSHYKSIVPNSGKILESKKDLCVSNIMNAKQNNVAPVCLGVVSLYQRVPDGRKEALDLFDPKHDDQLYLTTLSALVEAFLYESVPALTGDKLPSISLFSATRANTIESAGCPPDESAKIVSKEQYRTGLSWTPDSEREGVVKQETFCSDDFAPIVRNVIRIRERRNIYRALAIPLVYAEKKRPPKMFVCRACESRVKLVKGRLQECVVCGCKDNIHPDHRALHYVADQVLTDLFGNGSRNYEKVFNQLIPGEFEEGWDERFPDVIEASRALDIAHCDIPRAVAVFPLEAKSVCVNPRGKKTKPAIRDHVFWRIGQSLKGIDGKIFMNITRRL